jgi:4-amino-4-deoxy-L-arabinose transferase-like glycosyltransferase
VRAVSQIVPSAAAVLPRRGLLIFWLLLALAWFLPLNAPHLFDPDEGRYAEIPREMVASADWVTPRLNDIKYFEKPVLQYWATAAAFEAFGEHPWCVRLWPALCGFLGLMLTFVVARRLDGERTALMAVLIQASAMLYVGMARIATLDMSLSGWLQLSLSALIMLVARRDGAASPGRRWVWPLLLGVGVALAVLSKGLIGLLVPGTVGALYIVIHRDWVLIRRAQLWWSVLSLLLLAAPWLLLASRRNPEFAHFFFVVQHFQRYLDQRGFDRYQPAWFFIPVLLAGFLPWITLLPGALHRAWLAARTGDRASSLLLLWSGFIFVFFSASQSKLIPYIVPMVPALALITGRAVVQLPVRRLAAHLRLVLWFTAVIVTVLLVLWWTPPGARLVASASPGSITGLVLAFALLGLGAGAGARLARSGRPFGAVVATAAGGLLLAQAALLGADRLPRMQRVRDLATQLRPELDAGTRVYCVNEYLQSIPFYLQRPCTLVGYRGELDFGLSQEPWRFLPDLTGFSASWAQQHDALAIMKPADYQRLVALDTPMRVIYTSQSYVAVARE